MNFLGILVYPFAIVFIFLFLLKKDFRIKLTGNIKPRSVQPKLAIFLVVLAALIFFVAGYFGGSPLPYHENILVAFGITLIIAPVVEELMYRGVMLGTLITLNKHYFNDNFFFVLMFILIQAGVFVLSHDVFAPATILLGLAAGFAYYLTGRNLSYSIILHFSFNLLVFFSAYLI